jgi:hypothetical protein
MRVCNVPGCATLIPTSGRCAFHQREADRARGTTAERGYGPAHQRERRRWQARIDRAPVPCARCTTPIGPGDAWHLDHADDRQGYLGPSCARCNAAAGGRAAHR